MDEKGIVSISVEKIYQHPDNPRKDLGDLSELSESIKKKGVMQNLTVIPGHWLTDEEWMEASQKYAGDPSDEIRTLLNKRWTSEGYTIIIGHRRCAAAKMAGLKELPCRIVDDMSKKDQVSTMLEENMQRNDLTIWEQANGFQMMLDLGDTEAQIAEKTGFSRTTIRHRLNIAKLNQAELKKKEMDEGFQITLKDLYELEKIEDIGTRDKILKEARNSRDLVWKAKQAAVEETRNRNKKLFVELFKKAGIKKAPAGAENERYSGKWDVLQSWQLDKEAPEDLKRFKGDNVRWVVFWNSEIAVIVPARKQDKKLSKYEINEKKKAKAKKELKQKHKAMYAEIDRFLMGIIKKEITPLKEEVELYKALILAMIKGNVDYYRSDLVTFYSGKGWYELEEDDPEKYKEFLEWEKNLSPLHLTIAYMSSIKKCEMYNYNVEYHRSNAEKVKAIVDFLARYGFSVSEEEQRMIEGTHELYWKKQ